MIRTSNLKIRVLVKFSKSGLGFGFERTPCVDSDSRFEIRKTLKILDSDSRFVMVSDWFADSDSRFDPNLSNLRILRSRISRFAVH